MAGLEQNIHWVIIGILVLITLLYTMFIMISILRRRIRINDASREIALLKMDLLSKQAHLENLIEDSVEWTPRDLKKFDATLDQNRMLKSKIDTGMVLADSKVKRLELGNQTAELFDTLEKIKKYEDKLFGEEALKADRG